MTDMALPGSIEPAREQGPKLDHGINPITAILFLGVLTAGVLFVAYSIYTDMDSAGTQVNNYLPFILLFVALMIALGFTLPTAQGAAVTLPTTPATLVASTIPIPTNASPKRL